MVTVSPLSKPEPFTVTTWLAPAAGAAGEMEVMTGATVNWTAWLLTPPTVTTIG